MRTLEQIRAENALARVSMLSNESMVFKQTYRAYVDRMGPAIMMNGLGQALATENAAGSGQNVQGQAHRTLYDNVQGWLCRDDGIYPGGADLLRAIIDQRPVQVPVGPGGSFGLAGLAQEVLPRGIARRRRGVGPWCSHCMTR